MEYIDLETDLEIRFESERLDMLQLGYPPPPVLPPNPPPVIEQVRPDINKMVQDLASNGGGKITIKSNGAEITIEIPDRE